MKKLIAFDIEVLPNYFLIVFKGVETGKELIIDMFGDDATLSREQRNRINHMLKKYTSFGFNSLNYDMPIVEYALKGATCNEIYKLSKNIVENSVPHWMTYNNLGFEHNSNYDHFDLKEPAPAVMISLKNYGTRIGSKRLQEFYLDPHQKIDKDAVKGLKSYCINDVDVTIDLYEAIKDRIELRLAMGKEYGLDLRSKSDAQIAETIMVSEIYKHSKKNIFKPKYSSSYKAKYVAPDYIHFKSPQLNEVLELVKSTDFELATNGSVKMPKELSNKKIIIGKTTYKMGIGGLHSQEKSIVYESNDTHVMRNADFASFYPFIILNNELYPEHIGKDFLDVYRRIVETRLKAKAEGNKVIADSLKITINGLFGKFGSKYSKVYSPDLLIRTTITGQLTLLMLIEELEARGIEVVSANTDGLEYFCPREKQDLAEAIIFDLELVTGYEMEHGIYDGLYAKDVNNYIAKYGDKVKAKGLYAETTLSKGRSTPIVFKAIREFIRVGTPLEETITTCPDINEFVSARTVKGGAEWRGEYLGKMVRWYYSLEGSSIHYSTNGNLVPKTAEGKGVKPMMNLTDNIPNDLDYDWYINEAKSKLNDLGVNYETC